MRVEEFLFIRELTAQVLDFCADLALDFTQSALAVLQIVVTLGQSGLQATELAFEASASLFHVPGRGSCEFLTLVLELGNVLVQLDDFVFSALQLIDGGASPDLSFDQLILQAHELLPRALVEFLSQQLLALEVAPVFLEFQPQRRQGSF